MRLYIVRHGQSPSAREAGVLSDSERPLSETGRKNAREAGLYLRENEKLPQVILHSPLKRAQETALEMDAALQCPLGVKVFDPLSNLLPAPELYREVEIQARERESIILVGHQPQLGELAFFLCGKDIGLQPAQIIALELGEKSRATFLWSRRPQD